jgi:hypothetical protein
MNKDQLAESVTTGAGGVLRVALLACFIAGFVPAVARAQAAGGDVSASVAEAGAQALGGALAGATVEPSSGVLRSSLAIALPSARGAAQPELALNYSSAAGIREAGIGWGLTLPVLELSTRRGAPRLDSPPRMISQLPVRYEKPQPDEILFNGEHLTLICEIGAAAMPCNPGSEPLPPWTGAGWRYYRLENDNHARFFLAPSKLTWQVQLPGGEILEFGRPTSVSITEGNVVADPDAGIDFDEIMKLAPQDGVRRTVTERSGPFRWNLVRRYTLAPGGALPNNIVAYRWSRLGTSGRGYLTDVYYSPSVAAWAPERLRAGWDRAIATTAFAHHVHLHWNFIPQAGNRFTPVWRVTPDWTLARIDVASKGNEPAAPREMVRRYYLSYRGNQRAYLTSFQMEGRCGSPTIEENELLPASSCPRLPATTFGWSEAERSNEPVVLQSDPPFPDPAPEGWQLIPLDLNTDGLPDLVENNASFVLANDQAEQGYGAQADSTRRVYIGDGVGFKPFKLDGPAGLFSRFAASVSGDFTAAAATGAVLYFPVVGRHCDIAPASPCGPAYLFMGGTAYEAQHLGNTAGAEWYSWVRDDTVATDSLGTLPGYEIEAIGDVNGDGVPDLLDANTDRWKLFPDPVAVIDVRYGGRRPEGNGAYFFGTSSCVGPSMAELREFQWGLAQWEVGVGYPVLPVALADMNGDSLADLVIVGPGP